MRDLRTVTIVLAAACGLTVANLYYAQPLLDLIAHDLHVGQGTATTIVTLTQIGYAVGLLFVLPMGDLIENRKLVTRLLVVAAAALLLAAASPTFWVFAVLGVFIGVFSVVAQILVPFAAHLASPAERGRLVGRVMSGLLIGILLARTVSSLLADWLGWRAVYLLSAGLMLVLVVVLHRLLPTREPEHTEGYRRLLASVVAIAREEPVLRARAACQACMFGAFTVFWTAIAYELVGEHHLDQAEIGVFALVGAAGAAAAPLGGWLADRGHGRSGSGVMLLLGTGALLLAGLGHRSLVLLAAGGVLLDLAVQCHQVMGQQEIYALRDDARARINTVYMTSVFVGGAVASAGTGLLHEAAGWTGTCVFGAALPLVALAIWAVRLRPSLARRSADVTREQAEVGRAQPVR